MVWWHFSALGQKKSFLSAWWLIWDIFNVHDCKNASFSSFCHLLLPVDSVVAERDLFLSCPLGYRLSSMSISDHFAVLCGHRECFTVLHCRSHLSSHRLIFFFLWALWSLRECSTRLHWDFACSQRLRWFRHREVLHKVTLCATAAAITDALNHRSACFHSAQTSNPQRKIMLRNHSNHKWYVPSRD